MVAPVSEVGWRELISETYGASMVKRGVTLHRKLFSLVLVFFACGAMAQDLAANYPNRPLRFIVPYPPGALTDVLARVIGDRLASALRQPVVVENPAGAGMLIGADLVAKAPPDGDPLPLATRPPPRPPPAPHSHPPERPRGALPPVSAGRS